MKNTLKKIGVISGVTFVIAISFFAGLYVNAERLTTTVAGVDITGSDHQNVDMSAFWKAWDVLNAKYINSGTTTTDQQKVYGAIKGLADSLNDPYTTFFNAEENKNFQTDLSGTIEGIGAILSVKDGGLTVVSVIKGSPAEKAGMLPLDKITKIGDVSTNNLDIDKAISLVRGKKGTTVNLEIMRNNSVSALHLTITRDTINTPVVETKKYPNGVFGIRINSFTSNAPDLFRDALREYVNSGDQKLIIDLRDNTGGYLDAAVDMVSWFVPTGQTVVTEDFGKNNGNNVYRSKGYNLFSSDMKVVILVNENTASASEIFAGALRDYGRATLVGTKTFGKGVVQELVPITDDTMLKVTIARWLTPKGTSLSHDGLNPDYEVKFTDDDIKNRNDVQLNKALEVAGQQ
ncbi:MAG: ctpA [Candidatus Taylorbacteria bacterium]|nr:ctpA [Candidatus Taylorbacteria bacterium]